MAVSGRPLDHRPIALLNSGYKLFTKILSFRVPPLLSRAVLPAQVGFVPYRTIHTALDVFAAVKKASSSDEEIHGSVLLVLDFAKAYDTLAFLLSVLAWMGFSQRFVSVVVSLHHNTTCSFIVNNFHSRQRVVSCGI